MKDFVLFIFWIAVVLLAFTLIMLLIFTLYDWVLYSNSANFIKYLLLK